MSNLSQTIHASIQGTYALEKINKIRWRPDVFNNARYFLTGSWDNKINNIKLWDVQENEIDAESGVYPFVIANYPIKGDITEMKVINEDYFLASSSAGNVALYRITSDAIGASDIVEKTYWNKLHYFSSEESCSCTSFACYEKDLATVGEDGRINFLTCERQEVVRTIDEADSCSLHGVIFLKHDQILTSNMRGLMKIWDLRCQDDKPASSFLLNSDLVMPTCLAYHPTQRHIIVAGDEDGSVTVWDLRQNMFPVNLLNAHSESICELQFHPEYPDQLFSCSNSGELWHWAIEQPKPVCGFLNENTYNINPWLVADNIKSKLEVYSLLPNKLHKPVNSLDLNRDKIVCGSDNEAVYLINKVNLLQ